MLTTKRQKKGSGIVISEISIDKKIDLVAGIDAGSTETRVCLADKDDVAVFSDPNEVKRSLDTLMVQYKIPSTYANAEDAREIAPISPNLEDNYDSTIVLVHNKAEKPLLSRHRVLRGRKIQDSMGVTPRYLDSSTNKTDNIIFYTNIIDSLGYAIIQKYNGKIPTDVNVSLTLSVRPKEQTNKCKQKMNDNLIGQYVFAWRGISVNINIVNLEFSTEPEAEVYGTTTVCDLRASNNIDVDYNTALADRLSESSCFIHIEGGGSSIGIEVLRQGDILNACSSTFPLGGNYMAQVFIDRYRELQGRTVTKEAANEALITCRLRDGKNILDVAELVAQCKNQVAMDIVERLRHEVVDTMSDLTLQDVEFISLGGRLFLEDDAGNSISNFFSEYTHQISENTDILTLHENFIAQGNLVMGINSDFTANMFALYDDNKQDDSFDETVEGESHSSNVADGYNEGATSGDEEESFNAQAG